MHISLVSGLNDEMMTPETALLVLTNATAVLQANRQQHQEIATALQTLQGVVATSKLAATVDDAKKAKPEAK